MTETRCDRKIWLNGKILNVDDARINVLSPTAQFGANVFEGIRCYWNEQEKQLYAFRLSDHYNRLLESIKLFRIDNDFSKEYLEKSLIDVIRANEYREDIQVRQTVFVDGDGSWFSTGPAGMFIAPISKARKSIPLRETENVCISSWQRISDRVLSPRAKVGANYINSRLAKLEAMDNGFDSALFLNEHGFISEGTGSCFFMIKNGRIITPHLTDSILESITRSTIIDIAREELGMYVEERRINRTEVYLADEAFFCGSAVEIGPIAKIDGYVIGTGTVGEITKEIHSKYIDIVTNKKSKYSRWLTPIY